MKSKHPVPLPVVRAGRILLRLSAVRALLLRHLAQLGHGYFLLRGVSAALIHPIYADRGICQQRTPEIDWRGASEDQKALPLLASAWCRERNPVVNHGTAVVRVHLTADYA